MQTEKTYNDACNAKNKTRGNYRIIKALLKAGIGRLHGTIAKVSDDIRDGQGLYYSPRVLDAKVFARIFKTQAGRCGRRWCECRTLPRLPAHC